MGPVRGFKRRKRAEKKVEATPLTAMGDGPRDWWDDFSRRITGSLPSSKEAGRFESVFKISRKTFNYICSLVRDGLRARAANVIFANGHVMSIEDQVAIALRRLSSGDSLLSIGLSFGLNHSTVAQVTWRFILAMEERGMHHLRWPSSEQEMKSIKYKFERLRGLPNCCGAIDTTHITMCLPSADSSNKVWLDPEKNHSMLLQAIIDPEMRFRDIVTGWPGSMPEFAILHESGFFKLCQKGVRLNGQMELKQGAEVGEYIIGDSAFPLLRWLITPYQGKDLCASMAEFNKRHSATRIVAQRALARFKDTWRIVQGEMWRPDKHKLPRIILVCCILHNIIIDLEDEARDEMALSHLHDSSYKQQRCNFADEEGVSARDKLSHYLCGKLPP